MKAKFEKLQNGAWGQGESIFISKASHGISSVIQATPILGKQIEKVSRGLWIQVPWPFNQDQLSHISHPSNVMSYLWFVF